ncbi:MAG: hypothetical protein BECKG1743E_GA0114224_102511 [Candidatus Kentron sp. G]|nr:MAG: hypothetical protein BECKG1743E_GA0114224_102511 [Candidatus Kentron sp. G]
MLSGVMCLLFFKLYFHGNYVTVIATHKPDKNL